MTVTLYGIPNCDTVKKARNWLDEHGVDQGFIPAALLLTPHAIHAKFFLPEDFNPAGPNSGCAPWNKALT